MVKSRKDLAAQKLPYAHEHAPVGDFLSAVKALKPTGIIGVAAVGGTFTQQVMRAMTDTNVRPIIFALSIRPRRRNARPSRPISGRTGGRCLPAAAPLRRSRWAPRPWCRGNATTRIIFPGVGLGAIACGATRITDEMFLAAANALAAQVTPEDLEQGSLFPRWPTSVRCLRTLRQPSSTSRAGAAWRRSLGPPICSTLSRNRCTTHTIRPTHRQTGGGFAGWLGRVGWIPTLISVAPM